MLQATVSLEVVLGHLLLVVPAGAALLLAFGVVCVHKALFWCRSSLAARQSLRYGSYLTPHVLLSSVDCNCWNWRVAEAFDLCRSFYT